VLAHAIPSRSAIIVSEPLQILGIGNAIVDVVSAVDDAFLDRQGMHKGSMRLVDAAAAEAIYAALPPGQETSGGSVANTCAVAAALGARVGYLGTVADDQLGAVFRHDINAAGVRFPSRARSGVAPTARCLIAVTPDGQRTMNTYLGASVEFGRADIDDALVTTAEVTYLEGYLFDPPAAQAAFRHAAVLARSAGRRVALSLSDAFCVDRHRDGFRSLLDGQVDILFANEAEMASLLETDAPAAGMVDRARALAPIVVLTRGPAGSFILAEGATIEVAAAPARVVDTTGAGDAYAAGFLAGLTSRRTLDECGRLGAAAAALAIGRMGARPDPASLRRLVATL
jgi:sugar/nucleoside kinase (ribokinase family)